MSEYYIGIDFGTTTSLIAWGRVGLIGDSIEVFPEVIEIPQEGIFTTLDCVPSYVYFVTGKRVVVGEAAREKFYTQPERVVKSIKRQFGKNYIYSIDSMNYTAAEISAMILRRLKLQAEKKLRTKIKRAIFTVPASFDTNQRKDLLTAAEIAGFKIEENTLLDEPNSTFISFLREQKYILKEQRILDISSPKNLLVFDFGGGTIDSSVICVEGTNRDLSDIHVTPLGLSRYVEIGGDDFDELLAGYLMEIFMRKIGRKISDFDPTTTRLLKFRFNAIAEKSKIELSNISNYQGKKATTEIIAPFLLDDYHFEYELKMEEYEKVIEKFIEPNEERSIFLPIFDSLKKAELKPEQIDALIITGGMSQLPPIRKALQNFFGLKPIEMSNPRTSVVTGGTIHNFYMSKKKKEIIKPILSESIGIRTYGLKYKILIPAGVSLPIKKLFIDDFSLPREKMNGITITLYKGEDETALTKKPLTKRWFKFKTMKTKETKISIELSINKNKQLKLIAYPSNHPEEKFELEEVI